jgi:hypothetical protein
MYDTARVVRIIGSDDQPELVQINKMFMGQDGKPRNFDLSTGKYDVVVKVGPSFTTQREEVRSSMLDFMKMYPPAAPILGPFIAKNMDWPDADKVSDAAVAAAAAGAGAGPAARADDAAHPAADAARSRAGGRTRASKRARSTTTPTRPRRIASRPSRRWRSQAMSRWSCRSLCRPCTTS